MELWSNSGAPVNYYFSIMKRREAVIAAMASVAATVSVAGTADAETSQEANPELDQIRALLKAHDEAFTNQDVNGVLACVS